MILIALGSNLRMLNTGPLEICAAAAASLHHLRDLELVSLSPWYESDPIPSSEQPSYVNGVACLQGQIDPATLLQALQEVEAAHGRTRTVPNAARTLDLDIIAMGALVRRTPDPILPHPRMHERAFVLRPLHDVAPAWRHPVSGLTAAEMLHALPPQAIRKLPQGDRICDI